MPLVAVVVGWILGLASPKAVDWLGRADRREELIGAIATELTELRFLVALVLQQLRSHLRSMDQATLDLIRPILLAPTTDPGDAAHLDATKQLLALGDTAYIDLHNTGPRSPGRGPLPLPYEAPFLTAHLHELGIFPIRTRLAVLRIAGELRLFNQQVAIVQRAHERSFEQLSADNHTINTANLRQGLDSLGVRAVSLIARISEVVGKDGHALPSHAR